MDDKIVKDLTAKYVEHTATVVIGQGFVDLKSEILTVAGHSDATYDRTLLAGHRLKVSYSCHDSAKLKGMVALAKNGHQVETGGQDLRAMAENFVRCAELVQELASLSKKQ